MHTMLRLTGAGAVAELPDDSCCSPPPWVGVIGRGSAQWAALCSRLPNRVTGESTILRNSYGPLPDETESVTVQLAGLESYDDGISLEVAVQKRTTELGCCLS